MRVPAEHDEAMVPPGTSPAATPKSAATEAAPSAPLTLNQCDVLSSLAALGEGWWRPLDFGGHDGSHHSGTARRLAARGLLCCQGRSSLAGIRTARLYTINFGGRAALARAEGQ